MTHKVDFGSRLLLPKCQDLGCQFLALPAGVAVTQMISQRTRATVGPGEGNYFKGKMLLAGNLTKGTRGNLVVACSIGDQDHSVIAANGGSKKGNTLPRAGTTRRRESDQDHEKEASLPHWSFLRRASRLSFLILHAWQSPQRWKRPTHPDPPRVHARSSRTAGRV
jgi:hypothetical protein